MRQVFRGSRENPQEKFHFLSNEAWHVYDVDLKSLKMNY